MTIFQIILITVCSILLILALFKMLELCLNLWKMTKWYQRSLWNRVFKKWEYILKYNIVRFEEKGEWYEAHLESSSKSQFRPKTTIQFFTYLEPKGDVLSSYNFNTSFKSFERRDVFLMILDLKKKASEQNGKIVTDIKRIKEYYEKDWELIEQSLNTPKPIQ